MLNCLAFWKKDSDELQNQEDVDRSTILVAGLDFCLFKKELPTARKGASQLRKRKLSRQLDERELQNSFCLKPLRFTALDEASAREITRWRYGGRYCIYDGSADELSALLAPEHRYFAAWHEGELVGYCCFGPDARVPGGDYARGEPEVLDVGGGLRPDLAGKHLGQTLAQQALHFAVEMLRPSLLRVTVLCANVRARALCRRLGFREAHRFKVEDLQGREFVQLERGAGG